MGTPAACDGISVFLALAVAGAAACSDSPSANGGDGGVGCDSADDKDAFCATADPGLPFCVDDVCVECKGSSTCGADAPICIENACEPCGEVGRSEACMERNASTPVCAASGGCVACADHGDCASSVCKRDSNACVPEEQIIYVANGGFLGDDETGEDSSGCGIPQGKCLTIRYAIDNRLDEESGRTWVHIANGRYEEQFKLEGRVVQLIGAGDVEVEFQASPQDTTTRLIDVYEGTDLLVDQLVLFASPSNSAGIYCQGANRNRAGIRLQRSTISGPRGAGAAVQLTSYCDLRVVQSLLDDSGHGIRSLFGPNEVVVLDSTIRDSDEDGIRHSGGFIDIQRSTIANNRGGGIYIDETDFVIRNNFIYLNGSPGGTIYGGVKIGTDGPNQRVFEFNTVTYNFISAGGSDFRAPGVTYDGGPEIEVKNSIVWNNISEDDVLEPQLLGDIEVSYSNVEGDVEAGTGVTAGPGNIDTDPLFLDSERYDFRIRPESLAKDAADPEATVDIDFYGNPRPVGSGHDIGAHEVQD